METQVRLTLSSQTLPADVSLPDRIVAASVAGYAGIGLRSRDRRAANESGLSDSEIRSCLNDRNLEVTELETLWGWATRGEDEHRSRATEERLYELAAAVGGSYILAVSEVENVPAAGSRFAALCDRAADHGLRVGIEFMPWTSVPDISTAHRIVELSGRENGGIILDTWHFFRGGGHLSSLDAVPVEQLVAVQLSDAPASSPLTAVEETKQRLLPGAGAIPLFALVESLLMRGYEGVWAVEVIADGLHKLGSSLAASRSFRSGVEVFEAVGGVLER